MIAHIVELVFVPIGLGALVLVGLASAGRVPPEVRDHAYAGFWAGICIVAVYIVASDYANTNLLVKLASSFGTLMWALGAIVGAAGGFLVPHYYERWRTRRKIALVTFAVVAAAASSSFNYFFSPPLKEFSIALGFASLVSLCVTICLKRPRNSPESQLRAKPGEGEGEGEGEGAASHDPAAPSDQPGARP